MILSLCLTAPFFYLDIYFLKNTLFTTAPFYIPIVMALCMSIGWYIGNALCIGLSPFPRENNPLLTNIIVILFSSFIAMALSVICLFYKVKFMTFSKSLIFILLIRFALVMLTKIPSFEKGLKIGIERTRRKNIKSAI